MGCVCCRVLLAFGVCSARRGGRERARSSTLELRAQGSICFTVEAEEERDGHGGVDQQQRLEKVPAAGGRRRPQPPPNEMETAHTEGASEGVCRCWWVH